MWDESIDIWSGRKCKIFLNHNPVASKVVIMGIMDNDNLKWGKKLNDFTIESPEIMRTREWDKIIITPNCFEEIAVRLRNNMEWRNQNWSKSPT